MDAPPQHWEDYVILGTCFVLVVLIALLLFSCSPHVR